MGKLIADISTSLDGFVAGPDPSMEHPLGIGGEQLHEWLFSATAWREAHGKAGGEQNADSDLVAEHLERIGATIMGRKMFSGGAGPWEADGNADGWWGGEPPFRHPVFVLTHHPRDPLVLQGTTITFVTDGIDSALEQARAAAGGQDVAIGGGAEAIQQYLAAGLLDELQIHVVPVLLGTGTPLFASDSGTPKLECTRAVRSPMVTHLRYLVAR